MDETMAAHRPLDLVLRAAGLEPDDRYRLVAMRAAEALTASLDGALEEDVLRQHTFSHLSDLGFLSTDELRWWCLCAEDPGSTWSPVVIVDSWRLIRSEGQGADLRGAQLRGADLSAAHLRGADLSEADLTGADLTKADLTGATLVGTNLTGATLYSASLLNADLIEASLCRSDLRHVDMRGTRCLRTSFRGADFWNAYMWDVDTSEAFTDGADLSRADFLNEKVGADT